jgi:drug/metabolite transporter (DMT)-like permease
MMKRPLEEYPLLWANFWRLLGGGAMGLLLLPLLPNRQAALATLRNRRTWKVMVPASVIGTYVSMLFWLGGMKYTQISTASVLNQTATLWTFLLAAILLREPAGARRIAGLVLGLAGVALVTFGGR